MCCSKVLREINSVIVVFTVSSITSEGNICYLWFKILVCEIIVFKISSLYCGLFYITKLPDRLGSCQSVVTQ